MKLHTALLAAAGLAAFSPAFAEPPERTSTAIVYGDDPCPVAEEGEVVVCARRSDDERYRIPREFRGEGGRPTETAWGTRMEALEEAGRASMPGSCSPVGSYGQTGCRQQLLDQWYAERRARPRR
jgi:hypothetical protein